jgi:serine/threonine-protein kinase
VSGIAAVHSKNVIHRDLKPENIWMNKSGLIAKLGDFGMAVQLPSATSTYAGQVGGTPRWAAPEQFTPRACGLPSDVYAFALIALNIFTKYPHTECVNGRYGVPSPEEIRLAKLVMSTDYARAYAVIKQCLSMEPLKRPTAAQIASAGVALWMESGPVPVEAPKALPASDEDRMRDLAERQKRKQKIEDLDALKRRMGGRGLVNV